MALKEPNMNNPWLAPGVIHIKPLRGSEKYKHNSIDTIVSIQVSINP
jgi:predicted TIM-barrel enzyme